jgi:hypothetical protein
MSKISELFMLRPVQAKNFSKALPLPSPDPSLIHGIELEIEGVPNWDELVVPGMHTEEDGSLRNNGREFITSPMTYSNLSYCLNLFFNKAKLTEANYSERTSIHVHANCQDLESSQLQTVLLLYQVFEDVLFGWVGGNRQENIFCVPWNQTRLTYSLFDDPTSVSSYKRWQKYTALNLLPLKEYGTIEFRHMYGHCDLAKILQWVRIIGCMFAYARKISLETTKEMLLSLNTTSHYQNILFDVFGAEAVELTAVLGFEQLLEQGVLNIKYAFASSVSMNKASIKSAPIPNIDELLNDRWLIRDMAVGQRDIAAGNVPVGQWPARAAPEILMGNRGAIRGFAAPARPAPVRPDFMIMDDIQQEEAQ